MPDGLGPAPTRKSTAALPLCCQAWVAESLHALRHLTPQGQGTRALGQAEADPEPSNGESVRAAHDADRTPDLRGEPDPRTEGAI